MFGTENQSLQKNRKEIFGKKNKLSTTEAAHFNTGKQVSCAVCWAKNLSSKKKRNIEKYPDSIFENTYDSFRKYHNLLVEKFPPEKKIMLF